MSKRNGLSISLMGEVGGRNGLELASFELEGITDWRNIKQLVDALLRFGYWSNGVRAHQIQKVMVFITASALREINVVPQRKFIENPPGWAKGFHCNFYRKP